MQGHIQHPFPPMQCQCHIMYQESSTIRRPWSTILRFKLKCKDQGSGVDILERFMEKLFITLKPMRLLKCVIHDSLGGASRQRDNMNASEV